MKYVFAWVLSLCTLFAQDKGENMSKNPIVVMETNQGIIELELKPDVAPKACDNMMQLIKKGYYDGIIFHRVIPDFMIQGGDPTGTGMGGKSVWEKPFEDECRPNVTFNEPGILAMANSGPGTNGSQFFITLAQTDWLNGNHTIFGKVIKGYDVVKKIGNVKRGRNDKPIEEQKIIKMYLKV